MSRSRWKPRYEAQRIDGARCRASVHEGGRGVGFRQCTNTVPLGVEWCGTHSDEAEARRLKKTSDRRTQEEKESWDRSKSRARRDECEKALEGIDDPRALIDAAASLAGASWVSEREAVRVPNLELHRALERLRAAFAGSQLR